MMRTSVIPALLALVGSAVGLTLDESETFKGTASATGTFKRPLLLVDGTRYELEASAKADASVKEVLAKFSKGDTGTYVVKGTKGTVNGQDGIIVDSIKPADKSTTDDSETWTGTAGATGTYKRPLLLVDATRYELRASDKADSSVKETLAKFSKGDTGTYIVKGKRGTVNGNDGIIVDSIKPAEK